MNRLVQNAKTALFIVLFASLSIVYGNPVNQNVARKVGVHFLKNNTNLSISKDLSNCSLAYQTVSKTSQDESVVCFYIFNVADKGFVIVSADDCAKPILGYSTESSFDVDDIPQNMAVYLQSYERAIVYAVENRLEADAKTQQEWNDLKNNRPSTKSGRSVEPLLGTLIWHQSCYYNSLCPEDTLGSCGHVYAGCVATAMAQIIKFWNYPATGTGSHTYTPYGYPTQSANFGATTYNYSIMPDKLDSTSSEDEIFAVAQLQWHCGIAVDMMYGNNGSGAYSNDVPYAMTSYFGFSNTMEYEMRDNFYLTQWQDKLKASFDVGKPVYYSAQDDGGAGGHAFVCDGYDENDFFHFNWGWNGKDNGYYAIDALNPESTEYEFNTWQAGIFNMIPNAVLEAKAQAPSNFTVTPAPNYGLSALLSWTNPTQTQGGNPLTAIASIKIIRNGTLIHTIANPTIGADLTWTDNTIPGFGGYTYSIYAVTEVGSGAVATQSVGIGHFCPITVEMHDSYGDGWQGGAIDFKDENGEVVGTATMPEGSSLTETYQLPQGDINCVWIEGSWEYEISFTIFNGDGTPLYQCNDAQSLNGMFFTFDNQCETSPIECAIPTNLSIEYLGSPENADFKLTWDTDENAVSYKIFRDNELVGTSETNSFLDTAVFVNVVYNYQLSTVCAEGESIRTDSVEFVVIYDNISELENTFNIYPNPANDRVVIEGENFEKVMIYNMLGQLIEETEKTTINTNVYKNGVYIFRIVTKEGNVVSKRVIISD